MTKEQFSILSELVVRNLMHMQDNIDNLTNRMDEEDDQSGFYRRMLSEDHASALQKYDALKDAYAALHVIYAQVQSLSE